MAKKETIIKDTADNLGPKRADTLRRNLCKVLRADYVLANGSMSSNQSGKGDIRNTLVEADLVDCMVALPGQLVYSTQIPVCPRVLAQNKSTEAKRGFRDGRLRTDVALATQLIAMENMA